MGEVVCPPRAHPRGWRVRRTWATLPSRLRLVQAWPWDTRVFLECCSPTPYPRDSWIIWESKSSAHPAPSPEYFQYFFRRQSHSSYLPNYLPSSAQCSPSRCLGLSGYLYNPRVGVDSLERSHSPALRAGPRCSSGSPQASSRLHPPPITPSWQLGSWLKWPSATCFAQAWPCTHPLLQGDANSLHLLSHLPNPCPLLPVASSQSPESRWQLRSCPDGWGQEDK